MPKTSRILRFRNLKKLKPGQFSTVQYLHPVNPDQLFLPITPTTTPTSTPTSTPTTSESEPDEEI
jgi:hypothetical protein